MVEIKKVRNKKDLKNFIHLPWDLELYKGDPAWIPPIISEQKELLDPEKSHFLERGEAELFLAYKDNKLAGRISAHINYAYEAKYDMQTGFFGFYEAIDDQDVANALLDVAANYLRRNNKTKMNGPQSFSIYDSIGFDVEGNEQRPTTALFHFKPYYKKHVENYGFQKSVDWYCYQVAVKDEVVNYIQRARRIFERKSKVNIVALKKKELKPRLYQIKHIFNEAWEGLWGHIPLSNKQIEDMYNDLKDIIIPDLCLFAEVEGKTAGFIISMPDANPGIQKLNGRLYPWRILKMLRALKKTDCLRTLVMGVLPEYRGYNIHNMLIFESFERAIRQRGYKMSDCSLIVETNQRMRQALQPLGGEIYKTYRLFDKDI